MKNLITTGIDSLWYNTSRESYFSGERVTIELRVRLFTAKQSKIELGDRFLEFALLSATIQKRRKTKL